MCDAVLHTSDSGTLSQQRKGASPHLALITSDGHPAQRGNRFINQVSDFVTSESQVSKSDANNYGRMMELWFLFSLIWSICASVDEESRKKMDNFLRELEGQFPAKVRSISISIN